MPVKHRNKDAWEYLTRDHDVSGRHPPLPADQFLTPEQLVERPLER
jgi:hypothetical protein